MTDSEFTALMGFLCGADEAALWDAIAADADAGLTDLATLDDPNAGLSDRERAAAEAWRSEAGVQAPGDMADASARFQEDIDAARARGVLSPELDEVFAGDVLMPPPDFDSVWPEAHDVVLPDRDDYQPKFPIDPDEEVTW